MRKLIVGTLLIAILMSGCSNTMADIYDNESKITSDTNSNTRSSVGLNKKSMEIVIMLQ